MGVRIGVRIISDNILRRPQPMTLHSVEVGPVQPQAASRQGAWRAALLVGALPARAPLSAEGIPQDMLKVI